MSENNFNHPLVKKMVKILNTCETMEPVDKNTMEFHLSDGTIISMTLKVEHVGSSSTKH